MISSYFKQATAGSSSHRSRASKGAVATSYSSGSDSSDDETTSDYSSSILSFGSSAASPASTSEPSSWKNRATFSSTQDEVVEGDEDNDGTLILSDLSSTMGAESLTILPSPFSDGELNSPRATQRRSKTARPRRETFRPDRIDTLASPQYGMDALCSGVPIDCRSLDSQISILDRACDNMNLDDFTDAQCVNKLIEAEKQRTCRKRERALKALQQASTRWEESRDDRDEKADLDEVEIVFNQSTDADDKSGSLWNGLMLWEVKAPGSSPKADTKTFGRDKDILGSNVVVFSPAPYLRQLPRKSPRVDCSTLDNSTIPTEAIVETKAKEARAILSSCGHAISSKLKRRGRSADVNSLNSVSHGADSPQREQPCSNRSSSTSGRRQVVDDTDTGPTIPQPDPVACPEAAEEGKVLSEKSIKEQESLQSLASSDDDERKPALNIFLTRVPVHPETPSREIQRALRHDASIATTESVRAKDCLHQNKVETCTAKSPSRLEQLKMRFNESHRKPVNDSKVIEKQDSVEIMLEDTGVELLRPTLARSHEVDTPQPIGALRSSPSHFNEIEATQTTTPGQKNACLYDSEGNKISLGALKRIDLAPKSQRDVRQVHRASSQFRSVVDESKTVVAENKPSHVRPSVRDLVKAINEKEVHEKEDIGEKKKVLRIFAAQHKRNTMLRSRSERQSNSSPPTAEPLRRSHVSDVGPRRNPIPISEDIKDSTLPLRRSVTLTKIQATECESRHPGRQASLSDDNSILAPAENPEASHILDSQANVQVKEETPIDKADSKGDLSISASTTKTGRPLIDVLVHEKAQAQAPIEFSPIDFPIVSKQICSTDRLTREFILQGSKRDPPVVLYPLLDFNPCYEVFIFPSDVENHTFEKKQTLRPPRVPKNKVERHDAQREKRRSLSLPQSSAGSETDMVSSNGVGDGGIEVALAESNQTRSPLPLGKQMLGYVSHSRRADGRHEAKEASTGPAIDQLQVPVESPTLLDARIEISSEHQEDSDRNGHYKLGGPVSVSDDDIPGNMERNESAIADVTPIAESSLCSVLSKHRAPPSGTRTVDAVYEPSVEIHGSMQGSVDAAAKKHVTFRNWHVPTSFTNPNPKPKSQAGQLKSILRASSSHVQRHEGRVEENMVPSDVKNTSKERNVSHAIKPNGTTAIVSQTPPGLSTTPKTSNLLAKPTNALVKKIKRRNKTKKPTSETVNDGDGRESISSVRLETVNPKERAEPEGIEVEQDSQLLKGEMTPAANKIQPRSKSRRQQVSNVFEGLRNQARHLGSGSGPSEVISPDFHRRTRKPKATDTSTMMATVGDVSTECTNVAKSKADANLSLPKRTEIPEKLPLAPSADEFGFLDDSPPPLADGFRRSRVQKQDTRKEERSASLERVSRWIGSMRPSSQTGAGLTKRDRQKILKRNDKATRRFDDSALFRKPNAPIEKDVYNLLMEGNKTQDDIYQTLTEIAIARKKPNQSLAQAMNELEREVFQVYSEKCREKNEKKLARRKDFDRKLMRAIRKKTEKVVREENEKARRHHARPDKEPSLFQEAVDFFSSFVVCTEDAGLSPRRTPRSVSRLTKSSCLSSPGEDVVYTPNSDKRTFFA